MKLLLILIFTISTLLSYSQNMKDKKIYPLGKKIYHLKCKKIQPTNYLTKKDMQIAIKEKRLCKAMKDRYFEALNIYLWEILRDDREELEEIVVTKKDNTPPKITITNPSDLSIKLYKDEFFNLRWEISDRTTIRTINIYADWEVLKVWLKGREFSWEIHWKDLEVWDHVIKVNAIDNSFNTWTTEIKVKVINK